MSIRWIQTKIKRQYSRHRIFLVAAVSCFVMAGVVTGTATFQDDSETKPSEASQRLGVLLSPDHWTTLDGESITAGWSFQDGLIQLAQHAPDKSDLAGGHIITKAEFENFDLEFEWRIEKNGNSGLKYMVQKYGDRYLGLEYQIYDDDGLHKVDPKNSTGSIYDLFAPSGDKPLNPAGQWNKSRIVVRDAQIQHWLNDELITTANMHAPEWDERVAASKFNDVPGFCTTRRGRLMLTDHGSDAWYRILSFRAE